MEAKSIGIIGGGVLGKAIARGFMEHAEVRLYDIVKEKASHSLEEAATSDIVFVALPTPARGDGTCDTSLVEKFLLDANANGWWSRSSCYVIRSTVPVGFTRREAKSRDFQLPIFHSPEFLTARCSLTDFQIPARNIIGVPASFEEMHAVGCDVSSGNSWAMLQELYRTRFAGVPLFTMRSNSSELVKLACNSFFALKVQAFNLFRDIADADGSADWPDVLNGILSDGRIAHAHTAVPGPDGLPGFGGTCLPKDSADLYHCAMGLGVDADFLRSAVERNQRRRGPLDTGMARISFPPRG